MTKWTLINDEVLQSSPKAQFEMRCDFDGSQQITIIKM